jgi:hypothetical protein
MLWRLLYRLVAFECGVPLAWSRWLTRKAGVPNYDGIPLLYTERCKCGCGDRGGVEPLDEFDEAGLVKRSTPRMGGG